MPSSGLCRVRGSAPLSVRYWHKFARHSLISFRGIPPSRKEIEWNNSIRIRAHRFECARAP
jgi:hypothetical protein